MLRCNPDVLDHKRGSYNLTTPKQRALETVVAESVNESNPCANSAESVAALLRRSAKKERVAQSSRNNNYCEMLRRMQMMAEENRRLRAENLRYKATLSLSLTTSRKRETVEFQLQEQFVVGVSAEAVNKLKTLEKENRELRVQMKRMQEMVKCLLIIVRCRARVPTQENHRAI